MVPIRSFTLKAIFEFVPASTDRNISIYLILLTYFHKMNNFGNIFLWPSLEHCIKLFKVFLSF